MDFRYRVYYSASFDYYNHNGIIRDLKNNFNIKFSPPYGHIDCDRFNHDMIRFNGKKRIKSFYPQYLISIRKEEQDKFEMYVQEHNVHNMINIYQLKEENIDKTSNYFKNVAELQAEKEGRITYRDAYGRDRLISALNDIYKDDGSLIWYLTQKLGQYESLCGSIENAKKLIDGCKVGTDTISAMESIKHIAENYLEKHKDEV